jgi:hypothetical protein
MIEIRNSEQLQRWLLESGHLAPLWDRPRFLFDPEEFERELAGVRVQYPQFTADEAEARAALRLMGNEEGRGRAIVAGHRRQWTRRERLFLMALIALVAAIALLLCAPRAHAQELASGENREGFRSALLHPSRGFAFAQGGQPGGIIIQFANSGTVLSTTPAGLLQFNCSSGMVCSWTAGSGSNPPTFTLTSTGAGGSGCIPPGTTANALLFDAGSGACNDVPKFTWNNGTSTLALASGGIFDPTAGTMKVPGSNGQLLFNNAGALGAEDPIVSGPDARGAAQTKNPVAGLGGIDYATGCAGGPCVQEAKVDSSGNLYIGNFPSSYSVSNFPATQPVSWSGQSVSLTGSWPYSGTLGNVGLNAGSNDIGSVDQHGTWTVQPGNTANTTPWLVQPSDGTHSMPMGDAAARSIHVTPDSLPSIPSGTNSIGSVLRQGLGSGGSAVSLLNCDSTAVYDNTTNGATQLVALASGKTIYVCGYQFSTSQTTSVHVALEYGTGTNCATSPTKITPNYPLQAASSTGPIGLVVMTPGFTGLKTAASNELCIVTDAAVSVQAIVWYAGPF